MIPYEILDHTAEIGVKAYGRTREELFAHMAAGMFSLIVPAAQVRPVATAPVTASGQGDDRLLVAWLKELLFLFDTRHFLGVSFKVRFPSEGRLEAIVSGDTLDLSRHTVDKEIKAVTYCDLQLKRDSQGIWSAQVIFDI